MTDKAAVAEKPRVLFKRPKFDDKFRQHVAGWTLVVVLAMFLTNLGLV